MKTSDVFNAILVFSFFFNLSCGCSKHKVSLVVNASLEMLSPNAHTYTLKGTENHTDIQLEIN